MGFPGGASGKESTCQCRRLKRGEFNPWVGKISWRRAWQPTPVFLPGEFPRTEEPGSPQSTGMQRVGHDCVTNTSHFTSSSLWWCSGKESTCQCRRLKRWVFDPWVRKILWSRKWHSTPIFLPGESHGQRSLVGYSPWAHKESDMTENIHSMYYGSVEGHLLPWRNLWKKLASS